MSISFHHDLASQLFSRFGDDISAICVVFPTRRARLFFQEALHDTYSKTMWSPDTFSVEDWAKSMYEGQFPETTALIYEMYDVYLTEMRKNTPDFYEAFEKFYSWGEMLLKDFDEIDRYCVDAQKLYTNLRDLKEIEISIGLSDEMKASIQNLMQAFNRENYSLIQKKFLDLWEVMYEVYANFRSKLKAKNIAYEGMAFRELADEFVAEKRTIAYPHIVFAGFNALTKSEEIIIEKLLKDEKASIYWDSITSTPQNSHVILDKAFEFVRNYHRKWKNKGSVLIAANLNEEPKTIRIIGVPQNASQAHFVGEKLYDAEWTNPRKMRHTGVILADENLLFPVLYSLPQNTTSVNVTIGFPLRYTSVYQLLIAITRLIRNTKVSKAGNFTFYHKALVDVLQNPLIQSLATGTAQKILHDLSEKNSIYVPKKYFDDFTLPPLLALIFSPPASEAVLFAYFERIFENLLLAAEKQKWAWDAEYLSFFYRSFQQMRDILGQYKYLSIKGFAKLFRDAMKSLKLPFEGEPLEGLQVMGMLETRTLDFEKLLIIGTNEGNLPAGRSSQSFIPNDLRNYFRLPKEDDKANIIGYHFFRLLKRAKEIDILYNSEVKSGGNTGEKSRYILQLLHILQNKKYDNIQISEEIISPTTKSIEAFDITIPFTSVIDEKLKQKYTGEEGTNALSVTALITYLECRLRFYFQYVAELKATRQIDETIDEMTFGEMTHEVMEQLYMPLVRKKVTAQSFIDLKPKILDAVKSVFEAHGYSGEDELTGKNFLYRDSIMIKVCERFILQDAELVEKEPFIIESIEPKDKFIHLLPMEDFGFDVRITGNFDRLDKLLALSDSYRIVDYKTGKTGDKPDIEFKPESTTFEKLELQGALYAYLFHNRFPQKNVKVGFYSLKQSGQGIKYLKIKDKNSLQAEENPHGFLLKAEISAFEIRLKAIIKDVFTQPFMQTEDEKKCLYCDFKTICNRNVKG